MREHKVRERNIHGDADHAPIRPGKLRRPGIGPDLVQVGDGDLALTGQSLLVSHGWFVQ
jgi:hypothetical protein